MKTKEECRKACQEEVWEEKKGRIAGQRGCVGIWKEIGRNRLQGKGQTEKGEEVGPPKTASAGVSLLKS